MANTIRLKHQFRTEMPLRVQYFYDGRAQVTQGVIELPADKPAWIDRSFQMGFRLDPETGRQLSLMEVRALATAASAESAGDTDEGTDGGGQSAGEDGLRESEPTRADSVSTPRVASRKRNGAKSQASRGSTE